MGDSGLLNTVYIRRCEEYDRKALYDTVTEGMRELEFTPKGKIYVKPNVVVAHRPDMLGAAACTPAEIIGATMQALSESPGANRVDLGENSSVGFPTRMCYKYADYYEEIERLKREARCPVGIFCIDEELRDPVFVGGLVHEKLRVSRRMNRADTKVYIPKLKCHCVSNMTATVKLNIGICSDDERSIRHDFLLNEKIVDLLSVGYPDFTVMDAIDVGVGNEGFPILRKLGLVVMGRNPIAVDMVGARLLGFKLEQVPYLKRAIERGYEPSSYDEITVAGDLKSFDDVDEAAKRIMPYDDEFTQWHDVSKELARLESPIRFHWGPYRHGKNGERCMTGCVMGLKMFLAALEKYGGAEQFKTAKPLNIVIGNVKGEIDCRGADAFMYGSCAKAELKNVRKVIKIDKCFTTVSDMMIQTGPRFGLRAPILDKDFVLPIAAGMGKAAMRKIISGRYLQDIAYFITQRLERRI